MALRISRSLLDRIVAEAAASPALEICGLLLGAGGRVERLAPAANVAASPATRFEVDPATLLDAMKAARAGGPGIIGHYHSHPSGEESLSACDAEMAADDGAFWLLVARGRTLAWCAGSTGLHGRFQPVDIVVED